MIMMKSRVKPELLHEAGGERNHWKRGGEVQELSGRIIGRVI